MSKIIIFVSFTLSIEIHLQFFTPFIMSLFSYVSSFLLLCYSLDTQAYSFVMSLLSYVTLVVLLLRYIGLLVRYGTPFLRHSFVVLLLRYATPVWHIVPMCHSFIILLLRYVTPLLINSFVMSVLLSVTLLNHFLKREHSKLSTNSEQVRGK